MSTSQELTSAANKKSFVSSWIASGLHFIRENGAFIAEGFIAVVAIVLYSWKYYAEGRFISVMGIAVMLSFAALALGGLLGFLFAIPRAALNNITNRATASTDSQLTPGTTTETQQTILTVNTNLEQISDWLTKILVGVGLTQIGQVPKAVGDLAASLGPALAPALVPSGGGTAVCDCATGGTFGIALLIYSLIAGFLQGYVYTRFYLVDTTTKTTQE